MIKDLQIRRLFWNTQAGLMETQGSLQKGDRRVQVRRRHDDENKDRSDVATGQEMQAASEGWKGRGTDSPQKDHGSANTLVLVS